MVGLGVCLSDLEACFCHVLRHDMQVVELQGLFRCNRIREDQDVLLQSSAERESGALHIALNHRTRNTQHAQTASHSRGVSTCCRVQIGQANRQVIAVPWPENRNVSVSCIDVGRVMPSIVLL